MAAPGQQLLHLPFQAGIDEATRPELADPMQGFRTLENIRQPQRGVADKRYGFTSLSAARYDGTTRTAGAKLLTDGKTVCVIDGANFDAYDPTGAKWRTVGRVPDCSLRLIPVPTVGGGNGTFAVEDVESANGYTAIAYRSSDGSLTISTWGCLVENTTGTIVSVPVNLSSTTSGAALTTALASYGVYICAVVIDGTARNITAAYIDTTSPTTIALGWQAIGTLASDLMNTATIAGDVGVCSLSNRIAFAYQNDTSSTARITVKTFTIAGVVDSTTLTTASATLTGVDVSGSSSDTLWVSWGGITSGIVKLQGLNPSNLASTLATQATVYTGTTNAVSQTATVPSATAGAGVIYVTEGFATSMQTTKVPFTTSGGAATPGTSRTIRSLNMAGRPFRYGMRFYLPVFHGRLSSSAATEKDFIVVDTTDDVTYARPVAAPAVHGLAAVSYSRRCKTIAGSTSSIFYTGLSITKSGVADAAYLVEMDFGGASRWQPVAHNNSTFLSGGVLSYFDGKRVAESGFLVRPAAPQTSLGGTGITAVTGYSYVAIYEEVDADGNWCVSGISDVSFSTGAFTNKTVTVNTIPLTATARIVGNSSYLSSVRVAFYRTADGNQPPYYRLATITNDFSSATISYADATTDATLTTRAKLYAPSLTSPAGASLDRRAPPFFNAIVSYNGMLVGAYGSDVWWSGQTVSGEATWFNPVFQVPVPGEGDITGLAVQDGTLFIFKRSEVYATSGDAPSDNGASGGLGTPRRLASDVGCIDPRSIVLCADGIFFQSARGIEILSRAQSVDWIGEKVSQTTTSYPVCTGATLEPLQSIVRFEMAASETANVVGGNGRTLVYDLRQKLWVSIDRRANSSGVADAPAQSAAMVYSGGSYKYAWLSAGGIVHVESTSTYLDGSTWVTKRAVPMWTKFGGLQGLQHVNKVLVLAKAGTDNDLSISFAYDYSSSYRSARTYTAANLTSISAALPNLQLEHLLHDDAESQALSMKLEDATPTSGSVGTGQGSPWIGLTFEAVPKPGAYHLPSVSR